MFKTKYGKLKLGLYVFFLVTLATLLTVGNLAEASLVRAQKLADSAQIEQPTGRVLQATSGTILKPSQIKWANELKNNFVRITKDGLTADGKPVVLSPDFKLISPDKIEFYQNPGSYIESFGGSKNYYVEELRVVGIKTSELDLKCKEVQYSDCFEQYESPADYYQRRVLNSGQTASFYLELTPGNLKSFGLASSPTGQLNEITVFPRVTLDLPITVNVLFVDWFEIKTLPAPYDQDFPDTGVKWTIQVYDTMDQLKAAKDQPPPAEVTEGSTASGSGQDNRLKTCLLGKETLVCILNLIFGTIGTLIETAVRGAFLLIIGPAIEVLTSIHTWDDNFANVIYSSWLILRNLTNIAFILAIVAMGVATVFRISGYAVKDMMVKLIIGAFLVNFSLVIPQAILGIAETVQNQFLPPNTGAIRAIANPLFTLNLFNGAPSNVDFGSFSESVRIFMNVWMIVFAFIAFAALACLLIIRLAIIWLLLLSSPLPYAAMIFPATRKFASDWWGRLIEWAFITPVMAFMLNLTANITLNQRTVIEKLSNVKTQSLGVGDASVMYVALSAFLPIIFLFATLKISTALATKAGGLASTVLSKASTLTGLGAGGVMGYVATKPATKVAKNIGIWAKDRTQMGYLNQLNKLKPKEGDETTRRGRLKSWMKGVAFNVASGGVLTAENQAVRKGKIESKLTRSKGIAKDYRMVADKRTPQYAEQLADIEYAKDIKERSEQIAKQEDSKTLENIKQLLSKTTKLNYAEQVDLQAYLLKSFQKDKTLGKLLDRADAVPTDATGVPIPGKIPYMNGTRINGGLGFNNDINLLMRHIKAQSDDPSRAGAFMAEEFNAVAKPSGKLHLFTDPAAPEDRARQLAKINKIMEGMKAPELTEINPDVFLPKTWNPTAATTPGQVGDYERNLVADASTQQKFARMIAGFQNETAAANLGMYLNPEQKKIYQEYITGGATPGSNKAVMLGILTTDLGMDPALADDAVKHFQQQVGG